MCGGLVREAARSCPYCRSPVATLRCGGCYYMNIPEARHCSACGIELGLEPVPAQSGSLPCPICSQKTMDAFSCEDGVMYDCSGCGGQYLPMDVLRTMIARHEHTPSLGERRFSARNPLTSGKVSYRACPECRELMLRRNYGRSSGVILDNCVAHGTWFDVGELAAILEFVAGGGLAKQAALEAAERQRTQHDLAQLGRPSPLAGLPMETRREAPTTGAALTLEAASAFARWVLRSMVP